MSVKNQTWRVEGMFCPHCEQTIAHAVSKLSGLSEVSVDYRSGSLSAVWDDQLTSAEELSRVLKEAGYELKERGIRQSVIRYAGIFLGLSALLLLIISPAGAKVSLFISSFPVAKEGMSLGALFLLGLMTSLHCTAMCGGISIGQSASFAQRGKKPGYAVLYYNLGRVISYTVIGGVIGAVGGVFSLSPSVKAGIQLVAACFMLIMALNLIGGPAFFRRIRLPRLRFPAGGRGRAHSALVVGLLNGFMPCGPLQAMQIFALGTGSWWRGALSMLCFALGTVPLMSIVGLLSGRLNASFAKPMRIASAALVAVMGLGMLSNGAALMGVRLPSSSGLNTAVQSTDGIAVVEGDVQYVTTELDYGAYPPITVWEGIPVEWNLHAEEKKLNGCNNGIVIPEYGIEMDLQPGDNIIQFTPDKTGSFGFTCWMGMIHSEIRVVSES